MSSADTAYISFATGSIASPLLERVLTDALRAVDARSLLRYEDTRGLPELRDRIAAMHKASPDSVLVTSSAHQALSLAVQCTSPGLVLVQEPTYFGTWNILRRHGCTAHTLPQKPDTVLDSCKAIIVTSNFQNPTGACLAAEVKQYLAHLAPDTTIIEDNPYDLLHAGHMPTTIRELAPDSTLYIGSLSKCLAPGLRLGYVIAAPHHIEELRALKKDADLFTSTLSQQVCIAALRQDYLPALRAELNGKRSAVLASLEEFFGDERVTWSEPEGGIFVNVRFDAYIHCIRERAASVGLLLEKDEYMYQDRKTRNTTRLNIAQNSAEITRDGIRLLRQALEGGN